MLSVTVSSRQVVEPWLDAAACPWGEAAARPPSRGGDENTAGAPGGGTGGGGGGKIAPF